MINKTLAPIFVRFLSTGLNFVLVILLSNLFTTQDLGKYFIFFSTINLGSTFIVFGSNTYILRELHLDENIKNIALNNIIVNSLIFIFIFVSLVFLKIIEFNSLYSSIFFGSISLAIFKIISDYFKAKKIPTLSQFVEFSILPLIIILNITFFISSIELILFYSSIICFLISLCIVLKVQFRFNISLNNFFKIRRKFLNLFFVSLVNTIYASFPYVIFPLFLSLDQLGIFGIAHKIISISGSIIMALSSIFNISFTKLYNDNKISDLNKIFSKSQKLSLFYYLILFITVIFFKNYLSMIFGDNFNLAYPVLLWMMLIRLISIYFAMSEHILNMTQKENYELISSGFSIFICLLFSFIYGYSFFHKSLIVFGIIYSSMFLIRAIISFLMVKKYILRFNE